MEIELAELSYKGKTIVLEERHLRNIVSALSYEASRYRQSYRMTHVVAVEASKRVSEILDIFDEDTDD